MTPPAIVFPDGQRAVRDLLRSLLAGRSETEAQGATVGTRIPSWRSDDAPALPYVAVRLDGTFRDSRLNGRASVRVVVWHRDEGLGVALASLAEGLLLSGHGFGVRNVGPLTGPIATSDPETGDPMTSFTVTARLRPVSLTD